MNRRCGYTWMSVFHGWVRCTHTAGHDAMHTNDRAFVAVGYEHTVDGYWVTDQIEER